MNIIATTGLKPVRTPEPEPMTQELYDTIRMYVDAGHALHPEHARSLLHAFEILHDSADNALEGASDQLSQLLYDADGDPILALANRNARAR